jgi:hypothetical protein
MKYATSSAICFTAALLFGLLTRADVIPPEIPPCNGKQVGDACTYKGSGICQNQTCTRLDYSNWGPDGGQIGTVTYTCLECLGGTSPDGGPKPDAWPIDTRPMDTESLDVEENSTKDSAGPSASDTSATSERDAPVTPALPDAATTGTRDAGAVTPSHDNGSCSVGRQTAAKRVAPWLMAGAFSLLFLFARRRRR